MPLKQGGSRETISANIAELVRAGRDPKQAAAIAYREVGMSKPKTTGDSIVKIVSVRVDPDRAWATVTWEDERGRQGTTSGNPDNGHMEALLKRAQREGVYTGDADDNPVVAYKAGFDAAKRGNSKTTNPYKQGTDAYSRWLAGYGYGGQGGTSLAEGEAEFRVGGRKTGDAKPDLGFNGVTSPAEINRRNSERFAPRPLTPRRLDGGIIDPMFPRGTR